MILALFRGGRGSAVPALTGVTAGHLENTQDWGISLQAAFLRHAGHMAELPETMSESDLLFRLSK